MRRRKNEKTKFIYIIVVILIITFLSVGYSLFSERLNIGGRAHSVAIPTGPNLDVTLIPTGTQYTAGSTGKNFNFQNENINGSILNVTFTRVNRGNKSYTETLSINFSNAYSQNLTNGTATTQLISGNTVTSHSATLSKTTLVANETGKLDVTFTATNKATTAIVIRATMTFVVNGLTQTFTYNITIN